MQRQPQNLLSSEEAEVSVLGSNLLNNDTIDVVLPFFTAGDFYSVAHQKIFESILAVHASNRPVDLVILRDELQRRGDLEAVGGSAYIASLIDAVPAASNVEHYAEIVREKAVGRRLLAATAEAKDALLRGEKPEEAASILSQAVEQSMSRSTRGADVPLGHILSDREGLRSNHTLSWGLAKLDKHTGGIPLGGLTVIGAYPGRGKTALATSVLVYHARNRTPATLISLEMSRGQIAVTILGRESGLGVHRLRPDARLSSDEHDSLEQAITRLKPIPLRVVAAPVSAGEAAAIARLHGRKYGTRIVAIDYLQLLKRSSGEESRRVGIDGSVQVLKSLAQESGMAVVLLSQLARSGRDEKPSSAFLKESGGILEAADLVLVLDRPRYRDPKQPDDEMVVLIEKNRMGQAGHGVSLGWDGPRMRVFEREAEGNSTNDGNAPHGRGGPSSLPGKGGDIGGGTQATLPGGEEHHLEDQRTGEPGEGNPKP